jgi:hypothetical protein
MVKEGIRIRMERKSKEIDTKNFFIRSNLLSVNSFNKRFNLARLLLVQDKKRGKPEPPVFPPADCVTMLKIKFYGFEEINGREGPSLI